MIVLIGMLATVAVLALATLFAVVRNKPPTAGTSAPTSAAHSVAPRPSAQAAPPPPSDAAPSKPASAAVSAGVQAVAPASAAPSVSEAEVDLEAKAALEKLRVAVQGCARRIHQLPGTSPPVPGALAQLKAGPYKPSIRDWGTPFFTCAAFRLDEPMDYLIQWQFKRPDGMGAGLAWVDADRDGTADRAYAFTVTADPKLNFEAGPVQPVAASRAVMKPR